MNDLERHAREWERFADSGTPCNDHLKKTCRRAAQSLRMELQTGQEHCSCHVIPMEDCRRLSHPADR